MLTSKEHYELMDMFERDNLFSRSRRFDKEEKSLWPKGIVYQDGATNEIFLAYRNGYSFGKSTKG